MGTKSTQFRTRGDFDGENTSGKSGVSWNTAQLGTASIWGIQATGGFIEDKIESGKKYRIHQFGIAGYGPTATPTSPYYAASPPTGWTFVVSNVGGLGGNIHYQVIAGGGGSGRPSSGGGGAGGFRTNWPGVVTDPTAPGGSVPLTGAAYPVSVGTYVCKVGDIGIYAGPTSPSPTAGAAGGMSEFYPSGQSFPHASYIRSYGGGMGSPPGSGYPGDTFGSGGGGGYPNYAGGPANGPSADPNHPIIQGYPGGNGPPNSGGQNGGGGGGGAGSAGSAGTPTGNGHGGLGVLSAIYPSPPTVNSGNGFYWAGGGGGAWSATGGNAGDGGLGGGGGGGTPAPNNPNRGGGGVGAIHDGSGSYNGGRSGAGGTGTGGGGGGFANDPNYSNASNGHGGRGSIIIRYEIAPAQPL